MRLKYAAIITLKQLRTEKGILNKKLHSSCLLPFYEVCVEEITVYLQFIYQFSRFETNGS